MLHKHSFCRNINLFSQTPYTKSKQIIIIKTAFTHTQQIKLIDVNINNTYQFTAKITIQSGQFLN
jgi:hypothetical protein